MSGADPAAWRGSLLRFAADEWTPIAEGAREQSLVLHGTRLRRVEITGAFVEADWCSRSHIVHVVEGAVTFEFSDGPLETLRAGETGFIEGSAASAHKVCQRSGDRALLIVVEDITGEGDG